MHHFQLTSTLLVQYGILILIMKDVFFYVHLGVQHQPMIIQDIMQWLIANQPVVIGVVYISIAVASLVTLV